MPPDASPHRGGVADNAGNAMPLCFTLKSFVNGELRLDAANAVAALSTLPPLADAVQRAITCQNWGSLTLPVPEGWPMAATTTTRSLRPHARSLAHGLGDFLTPTLDKQAQAARTRAGGRHQHPARWQTQPLLLVLVLLTYSCGDSQDERFQTAKAACTLCRPKRRRAGQTLQGFHKALQRLPVAVLQVVAAGVRRRLGACPPGSLAPHLAGSRLDRGRSSAAFACAFAAGVS